jgi:hypothetical protein
VSEPSTIKPEVAGLRVIVCGDRDWEDQGAVDLFLDALEALYHSLVLIEGCAPGADHCAEVWAQQRELSPHEHFPANWSEQGKAAGPIRNRQMLREGKPDLVLAFHDDIVNSKGTKDMVSIAKDAVVVTYVISH